MDLSFNSSTLIYMKKNILSLHCFPTCTVYREHCTVMYMCQPSESFRSRRSLDVPTGIENFEESYLLCPDGTSQK